MYKNVNTGEVWKLDHVESVPSYPAPITVYVFGNGERWNEELFNRHFVEVGEA